MPTDTIFERTHRVWTVLASRQEIPDPPPVAVFVSPRSLICPPDWVGIVTLDTSVVAAAPTESVAAQLRSMLTDLSPADRTSPDRLRTLLPVAEVMGPATLAYCGDADFRPAARPAEPVPFEDPELGTLIAAASAEDLGESALSDITSTAYVVRDHGRVVAAAGYRRWVDEIAHLSVFALPEVRGRGFAKAAAGAAVADALDAGLLPQWRARPEASRMVAVALGFREVGAQISLRLTD
jgi:RimJ/RimL family protein N-acetyltransferase